MKDKFIINNSNINKLYDDNIISLIHWSSSTKNTFIQKMIYDNITNNISFILSINSIIYNFEYNIHNGNIICKNNLLENNIIDNDVINLLTNIKSKILNINYLEVIFEIINNEVNNYAQQSDDDSDNDSNDSDNEDSNNKYEYIDNEDDNNTINKILDEFNINDDVSDDGSDKEINYLLNK